MEFGDECGDKNFVTPMSAKTHVMSEYEKENKLNEENQTRYQSGAGTLLYLVKHSRPDLSNAVRELTKGMKEASVENYKQLLRVITYVINNEVKGVELTKIENFEWKMRCYTDSD